VLTDKGAHNNAIILYLDSFKFLFINPLKKYGFAFQISQFSFNGKCIQAEILQLFPASKQIPTYPIVIAINIQQLALNMLTQ